MANHSMLSLLCLRGWLPKGEGDEDPQIKEGNKENKVKIGSFKINKNSGEPGPDVFWLYSSYSFLTTLLAILNTILHTADIHKIWRYLIVFRFLSSVQPKSGGGGRRRGGQRHKGKGQNSTTNSTAAPSSSGIGGCWTALVSCKPPSLLSLHQVSSFHKFMKETSVWTFHTLITPRIFTPGLRVVFFVFVKWKEKGVCPKPKGIHPWCINVSCLHPFWMVQVMESSLVSEVSLTQDDFIHILHV